MVSCELFANILLANLKYKTISVQKYEALTINSLPLHTVQRLIYKPMHYLTPLQPCLQQTLCLLKSRPSTKLIYQDKSW